jgi:hypothetical protein
MQNLYEKEESLQKIKNKFAADLAAKQGMIDAGGTDAREKKERADNLDAIVKNAGSNATAQQIKDAADAREAAKEASDKLQKAKDEKLAIRNGAEIKDKDGNPTGKYYTTNGNMTKDAMDKAVENTEAEAKKAEAEATAKEALAVSIEADATYSQADKEQARREAEDAKELLRVANEKKEAAIKYRDNTEAGESMFNLEVKDIPAAKRAISEENSKRKNDYADDLEDKLFNKKINRSASHRIRMDSEIKSEVKK